MTQCLSQFRFTRFGLNASWLMLLVSTPFLGGCQTILGHFFLPSEGIRPAHYAVDILRSQSFTTPDGIALVADVYQPHGRTPAPSILVRIPFSYSLLNRLRADTVAHFWASRGYNVIIQGTRGRYHSGGSYYPLRHEREDGIATLHWLDQQPWFDGRLGMWGGSVFGYTQWAIADQTAPGPGAFDIQIASSDFHRMFHPGGAFALQSALFWAVRSRGVEDRDPTPEELQRGIEGLPLIEADDRAVGDIPFFNDWVLHTTRDAYWRAIDGEDRPRNLRAPALLMAGWFDPFLPSQIDDFLRIRASASPHVAEASRLVIGPWAHAESVILPDAPPPENYRRAVLAPSLAWFDRHLEDSRHPTPLDLNAPVRIFVMGANVWRDEAEWPLARARVTPFYLDGDGHGRGQLSTAAHGATPTEDTYTDEPMHPVPSVGGAVLGPGAGSVLQNDLDSRPDVLIYTGEVLMQNREVTGPVTALLHVSTSAPNTDFIVKVLDVFPDGRAYNVTEGVLRQDYMPDTPTEIEVKLWPTSWLFKQGHRIRVMVSSSHFPRYDRNPNTGKISGQETKLSSARQTVHHSRALPSRILLPLIPPVQH